MYFINHQIQITFPTRYVDNMPVEIIESKPSWRCYFGFSSPKVYLDLQLSSFQQDETVVCFASSQEQKCVQMFGAKCKTNFRRTFSILIRYVNVTGSIK